MSNFIQVNYQEKNKDGTIIENSIVLNRLGVSDTLYVDINGAIIAREGNGTHLSTVDTNSNKFLYKLNKNLIEHRKSELIKNME